MSLPSPVDCSSHDWHDNARVHVLWLQDPLIQEHGFGVEWHSYRPIDHFEYYQIMPPNVPTDVPLCKDLDPVDTEELDNLVAYAAAHNILHDPVVVSPTLAQGASPWIFDKEQQAAFMEHEDEAFGENGNHAELNHDDDDENNYKHN